MSKKPVYVVISTGNRRSIDNNQIFKQELDRYINQYYYLEKTIEDVRLYRLK